MVFSITHRGCIPSVTTVRLRISKIAPTIVFWIYLCRRRSPRTLSSCLTAKYRARVSTPPSSKRSARYRKISCNLSSDSSRYWTIRLRSKPGKWRRWSPLRSSHRVRTTFTIQSHPSLRLSSRCRSERAIRGRIVLWKASQREPIWIYQWQACLTSFKNRMIPILIRTSRLSRPLRRSFHARPLQHSRRRLIRVFCRRLFKSIRWCQMLNCHHSMYQARRLRR